MKTPLEARAEAAELLRVYHATDPSRVHEAFAVTLMLQSEARDAEHGERLEAEVERLNAFINGNEDVTRLEARIQALREGLDGIRNVACDGDIDHDMGDGPCATCMIREAGLALAADDAARKG